MTLRKEEVDFDGQLGDASVRSGPRKWSRLAPHHTVNMADFFL